MKYHLAEFVIDTTQFQISSAGEVIAIEPKVFDLIVYLIENRQRLISREELFDQVWGGREVSDTSLSNHVKSARKALGDNGDLQKVVKTVRGRGYQFIANLNEVTPNIDSASTLSTHDASSTKESTKTTYAGTGFLAKSLVFSLLALVVFLSWKLIESDFASQAQSIDNRPYILVVPFDVSGDSAKNWAPFADQTTRELIRNLRKISGLRVVPPPSSFTFKTNKTRSYIRSQLPEVTYVLDGIVSVGSQGEIRITTELEALDSGELIWDKDYQNTIAGLNLFAAQAEIAESVSNSLQVVILDDEHSALANLPTTNLIAYELYVEGRQLLDEFSPQSLHRSIKLFSEAISLDPAFDSAYVARANAFRMLMTYFEVPENMLSHVVESVAAALEINPKSAEALSSLGLAYVFAWRWDDAWKILNEARELDSSLALTELGLALYYSGLGDPEGVRKSLATANKLDPLNIELADWGQWALILANEREAAVAWGNEKMKLHPEVGVIFSGAGVVASIVGDHDRAISLATKGAELDNRTPFSLLSLAQTYGYAGQTNKIPPLLQEAEAYEGYMCPYETAVVYLLLDEIDRAFKLLNEAVGFRSNCLIFTRNDSRLKPLHDDPRFAKLLAKVGLDNESIFRYSR